MTNTTKVTPQLLLLLLPRGASRKMWRGSSVGPCMVNKTLLLQQAKALLEYKKSPAAPPSIRKQSSITYSTTQINPMASSDVKVLGSAPSNYVNRVQIACNLKSVDYEFLEEKLGSKSELLLKSNPVYKKIPVMIHGGKPICESLVIVQYIDEVWTNGPSILPSDPYDRAMARFWAAYVDEKWWPTVRVFRSAEGKEAKAAALEQARESIMFLEDAFTKCGKGKDFFGGDTIGYVDIAFGSFLGWLRATEKMADIKLIDETKTPGLFGWAQRFLSNAAVKDVILGADKIVELIKGMAARPKA